MPGRFEIKPLLVKIWHAPDDLRILDPLPPAHRRGVIVAALAIIVGFLLPSADDAPVTPVSRTAQLDFQSQSQPQPDAQPLHAQLVTPSNDLDQVAPVAPEPVQEEQPNEQEQALFRALSRTRKAAAVPNGEPIRLRQGKRWRSCSATTICRRLTFTRWRR